MATAAKFTPLTNRSSSAKDAVFSLPDDGFVQLVPMGEAPNVLDDGSPNGQRIIQVVDEAALSAMMNKLLNRDGEELLIDDEHHSHDASKSTDANGWQLLNSDSLVIRADGLYGSPRWSTLGLEKLVGGVKRYISPEFQPSSIVPLGGKRYRVTELTGLALTNRPGFRRLQKALTNRDAEDGIDPATQHTMHKALLAAHLGLTESVIDTLDEDALKNRLSAVKAQAAQAVTLLADAVALKNREADEFINTHKAVIPPNEAVRQSLRDAYLANRETAKLIIDGFTAARGSNTDDGLTPEQRERANKRPLFNRSDAQAPENAEAKVAALHNRALAYRDTHKVSYERALAVVRSQPES